MGETTNAATAVPSTGLFACPFCGSKYAHLETFDLPSNPYAWIECDDCMAQGPWTNSEVEAVAAWNRRAPVEGVDAVVVECESVDDEDDSENIAVINDLPREWIGKAVRVTLKANAGREARTARAGGDA